MDDKARVTELLQPYLNNGQFYIVDIQVVGRRGGRIKVTVLVDSDTGITIDECAEISRRLGSEMDEINFFGDAPFTLEVSSPGVDFPLTFSRQFVRNIGRQLAVNLTDGSVLRGTLESVDDTQIVLVVVPEPRSKTQQKKDAEAGITVLSGPTPIRYDQIKKATVEISFK
ncbi:ribosome maturation factor RimP [Spirosoma montaniterrae]|uniref:Ribosome maturation factor RimP n=1 Tax=Spirosoma montaniterrae TaxID=1178516 RepID=A0A1P9WY78_9BACT|nr:ribosome maturation factor RimP [Spirosoma montaniterrae]AQG80314.1 ribosome assembly cofactor RimP [Spirosoma montaniterrae]